MQMGGGGAELVRGQVGAARLDAANSLGRQVEGLRQSFDLDRALGAPPPGANATTAFTPGNVIAFASALPRANFFSQPPATKSMFGLSGSSVAPPAVSTP